MAKFRIVQTDALIIGDVQRDFLPGGALQVPEGDQVVPVLNRYIRIFEAAGASIFATRDWHPPNHMSFKPYGGIWPPHCIQGTGGAEFHPDLKLPPDAYVVSKATDPSRESYSAFGGTELEKELRKRGLKRVFMGGVATDYCVKNTVIDALKLGFKAVVLLDAIRGIDLKRGDSEEAVKEMIKNGAKTAVTRDGHVYPHRFTAMN